MRELWQEYWAALGLPGDFQGFEEELMSLPGEYQRLLVESVEGRPAGTIAMRPLSSTACEIKRLYVRPAFRGQGIARRLLERVLSEAATSGYTEVFCDTLPGMYAAIALYRAFGFEVTAPYSDKPTPGAIFLTRAV